MNAVAHDTGMAPVRSGSDSLRMIRTLVTVATLSGFIIVLAYQVTLPIIEANEAAAIEQAVFQVVPGAARRTTFGITPDGGVVRYDPKAQQALRARIHAAYDESGGLVGVAVEASVKGYADVIKGLYGYSPDKQIITGLSILENKETPGLGDKIAKDPEFRENFLAMDVRLNEGGDLAHPITAVKQGQKTDPWQIDGISGATISSKAVAQMLQQSASQVLPVIRQHLDELKAGANG